MFLISLPDSPYQYDAQCKIASSSPLSASNHSSVAPAANVDEDLTASTYMNKSVA